MKKLFTLVLFSLFFSFQGKAQFDFGAGVTYFTEYSTVGVQANTMLGISNSVDLSGAATIAFESGTPLIFDIDAHYHLLTINDATTLSPFGGLNIITQKDYSDLGVNIGASLIIPIEDKKLYIESKYIIAGVKGLVFTGGILF